MNEQSQIQPVKRQRHWLRYLIGGIAVVVVAIIVLLMLMGPIVGNVYSDVNMELASGDRMLLYGESEVASVGFAPAESPQQTTDRLIIRNGYLTLTVENTLTTQQEIEKIVAGLADEGAFLVSSSAHTNYEGESPYIDIAIRIPATEFDEIMDRLAGMAVKVDERTESAQDVTAEYVDIETRLETLEAARDRLLEIMKQSATTEELLLAEQQLTQRETEIESLKGRMKFLSESARLSSITINLHPYQPSQPLDTNWRPAETTRRAFDTLVNSLRGFADFMILFVIAILPWLLFFGGIWIGISRVIKRRRARKQEETMKAEAAQKQ
jgi:hypothetical protein